MHKSIWPHEQTEICLKERTEPQKNEKISTSGTIHKWRLHSEGGLAEQDTSSYRYYLQIDGQWMDGWSNSWKIGGRHLWASPQHYQEILGFMSVLISPKTPYNLESFWSTFSIWKARSYENKTKKNSLRV